MKCTEMQEGFTLIELMIVVAIIGILAAIALPQYQQYIARSELVEETTYLDAQKIALTEAYGTNAAFPAANATPVDTTLPKNMKYSTAISYTTNGTNAAGVIMTLGGLNGTLNGQFLGLFGAGNTDNTVTWTCATAAANTATAPAATGIVAMYPYLPAACQH